MKSRLSTLLLFALLTLSCQTENRPGAENENMEVPTEQSTPRKLIEYLVGEWAIDSAGGGNQQNDQRIFFTNEARYILYSGREKVDSGAYRMNEQLKNLYLQSEVNEQTREYEVQTNEEVMTLKPNQTQQQAGEQTATYRRIGSRTSPQR